MNRQQFHLLNHIADKKVKMPQGIHKSSWQWITKMAAMKRNWEALSPPFASACEWVMITASRFLILCRDHPHNKSKTNSYPIVSTPAAMITTTNTELPVLSKTAQTSPQSCVNTIK
jgi:hypothetical protein